MSLEAGKNPRIQNSFIDALHSEIIAGTDNLTKWIKLIQEREAIESLFGMETWLKAIRSFFDLEHLPLGESDRAGLAMRGFAPEIGIVHQALQHCESFTCEVIRAGYDDKFEFEDFIEDQMRRDRILDSNISRIAEQLTPADSLSHLLQSLNDLRVTIDSLNLQPGRDFQLFVSLGRGFTREIKNCRYVDMLLSQRFKLQYDLIENKALIATLREIPHETVRRNVALVFLYLFRFLKYLKIVMTDLGQDMPLKQHLAIFSLLHAEMGDLNDFLKTRVLRTSEVEPALQNAAELVAYSIKMESQRVQARELIAVARETDPRVVYSRIENSHGLLRNCCQSCIISLIQSLDKNFDGSTLFPARAGQLVAAEKLRQDLWDLRRWLMDLLGDKEEIDSTGIVERITVFKDSSIHSLMYRDWAEFESFCDALVVSISLTEIRTRIRKFVSYLETLIQEVSKRSVFRAN
jgi:hypothetical protein